MEECIFCKIINKEIPAEFLEETDNFIVINDAHPVSDGHCLIIPKKHYKTLFDMPNLYGNEVMHLTKKHGLRLLNEQKGTGIKVVQNNFEAAGQVVPHVHIHVIPFIKDEPKNHLL